MAVADSLGWVFLGKSQALRIRIGIVLNDALANLFDVIDTVK